VVGACMEVSVLIISFLKTVSVARCSSFFCSVGYGWPVGGHGGFHGFGRIMTVGCYVAMSTGSAAGVYNFWVDVVSLQIAILFCFCHFRGFVAFGWWVGGLAWLASHCHTRHGQKGGLGLFPM